MSARGSVRTLTCPRSVRHPGPDSQQPFSSREPVLFGEVSDPSRGQRKHRIRWHSRRLQMVKERTQRRMGAAQKEADTPLQGLPVAKPGQHKQQNPD